MNLDETILTILTEFIQTKNTLGQGAYKRVFPYIHDENYVVKKFDAEDNWDLFTVRREVEFGEKHPDLVAKIVKINYEKGWLIQEKLNVEQMKKAFDSLTAVGLPLSYIKTYIKSGNKDKLVSVKDKLKDPFFDKLYSFFQKLEKAGYPDSINLDIHEGNFGFDKRGNIKLLDL